MYVLTTFNGAPDKKINRDILGDNYPGSYFVPLKIIFCDPIIRTVSLRRFQ